jgi:hypothetical protein
MRRTRFLPAALSVALALLPATSDALAPAVLFMVKQIVQQTATSMLKDAVLSSLSGMGCKGIALGNAIQAVDLRKGGGAALAGLAMPNMPSLSPSPMSMSNLPPEMAARMNALVPGAGQMPPGIALGSDQAAMMARMQQAMSQPLSAPETVAVIDELFALGFLPRPIQAEFKECLVLVPASVPVLGMAMGMMKPIVPQLRRARDELQALSPAEQDEVAAAFVQEAKALSRDERAAFVEHLDSGFFPPRIAGGVKRLLATP